MFSTLISLPDLAQVESLSASAESIDDNDELVVASSGRSLIEAILYQSPQKVQHVGEEEEDGEEKKN